MSSKLTNFKIVIPSNSSSCLLLSDKNIIADTIGCSFYLKTDGIKNTDKIKVELYKNNKLPIVKLYNNVLEEERNLPASNKSDFLIFMHNDVKLLDTAKFFNHILEIRDRYDIIGLAGTRKINLSHTPLTWFTGSSGKYIYDRFGSVISTYDGRDITSNFNSCVDITDTPAVAIDGLCMIFSRRAIESGILFDEIFSVSNDFYDLDISLQAIQNYKLRIGVMVETIYHKSVGAGIFSGKFAESEKIFRKKWTDGNT